MNFVWSAVLALGIGGTAFADDDEAKTPARTYTQAEIEALQDLANRVLKLEEFQQDAELEKLKAAAAKEKQDESKALPERVSALEKKMGSAGQTFDASKQLTFSTPDGNFTAKVGGRFYFVYRHIFDRQDRGTANNSGNPDSFIVDTARFQLDGTFFKDFYYRIEGEAKSGEPGAGTRGSSDAPFRTKDAFMGWQGLGDWVSIQAGQFKMPFSQEETCSSRFIDFGERSILNRLVPGHVTGIMAKGALFDKIIEWNLGFCNGATRRDFDKGSTDLNDEKDGFGRLFITPMKTSDIALLKQLRIGGDFSRGTRDRGGANDNVPDISSGDLGLPVLLDYSATAFHDGIQSRWLGNFSWVYGPASIRAEYLRANAQVKGGANTLFHQAAWYISASYVLTGEEKALENRIKPKANFSPLDGQWGAFELAARWAVVDGRNARDAGVSTAASLKVTEYTLGLNWWMAPNVVVRIDWERLTYEHEVIGTGNLGALRRYADEIYIRWQIDF